MNVGDQVVSVVDNSFSMIVVKINDDGTVVCQWIDKNTRETVERTYNQNLLKLKPKLSSLNISVRK